MPDRNVIAGRGPVVAIVGGGASGTLTAVLLLRTAAQQQRPVRIILIDSAGRHGLGQAYGTTHPWHLLNTPAQQMSALADDPGHLVRWAAEAGLAAGKLTGPGACRSAAASSASPAGELAGAFLPRRDYGRYLQDTLAEAERLAGPLGRLSLVSSQVTAIRPGGRGRALRLMLANGSLDADVAVLATGNLPPALPFPVPAGPRIITDPWAPGALEAAADGSPVVIAGTGLTMIDVAVAVTGTSRRTAVHAISRHGLLPRVHRGLPAGPVEPVWLPVLVNPVGPVRLAELMWQVRTAMTTRPDGWQDVIDGLRPYLPSLWRRMPAADRQLFLRHVARYWEVHRHRMPPQAARRIAELRCTGQLSVHHGRITAVTEQADGLRIRLSTDDGERKLTAGWLVNATGAGADVTAVPDPLLADLLGSGLARPGPLRLGIDATADGAVLDTTGAPSSVLFTLGPPLRGLWYETTAIAEIRQQAAALARRLVSAVQARELPGSAA